MNRLYDRIDRELPDIALKYGLSENTELEEAIRYLENFARIVGQNLFTVAAKGKPNYNGTVNGLRII